MRMWMIPARLMCSQHLRGEHAELHMLAGSLRKGVSLRGFCERRLVEVKSARQRHDEIVEELKRRGSFKHRSTLRLPKGASNTFGGSVDVYKSIRDLTGRCADCRQRTRYLLIGQAPSQDREKLSTYSFRRMMGLARLFPEDFPSHFDHVNLLDTWPGKAGLKGDLFPIADARGAATRMVIRHRHVIMMGKRVAAAFGIGSAPYLEEQMVGQIRVIVLPHPSGINRWWNEAVNQFVASQFMLDCVRMQLTGRSEWWSF